MAQHSSDKEALIAQAAKTLGIDPSKLKEAMENNSQESLMHLLPAGNAAALQKLLSDPESLKKLMNSPQAQMLFRQLGGK